MHRINHVFKNKLKHGILDLLFLRYIVIIRFTVAQQFQVCDPKIIVLSAKRIKFWQMELLMNVQSIQLLNWLNTHIINPRGSMHMVKVETQLSQTKV